ncbi:MAG: hypothetical protein FWF57_08645 [Defluviitaleaceae bacterium]|nr:hypothetical protein [Defluviitaleaceae bacterium]
MAKKIKLKKIEKLAPVVMKSDIGKTLENLRNKAGRTIGSITYSSDGQYICDHTTIWRIEKGKISPNVILLIKILNELGFDLKEFAIELSKNMNKVE